MSNLDDVAVVGSGPIGLAPAATGDTR